MMYWLRFAMVCASAFILLYALFSLLLSLAWSLIQRHRLIQSADALFTLRILPAASAVIVLALAVAPSFWELEPAAADEWIGGWAVLLSVAWFAWAAVQGAHLIRAWRQTAGIFKRAVSRKLDDAPVAVYEIEDARANLFIAGIVKPRLLISRGALELLDADELRAAIRHELAHTNAGDNLKQIIVRLCSFPLLASLDSEWLRAVEIAADDRSVNDALMAADLASALIKVGTSSAALAPLGMSLVPTVETPISDRVRRLLNWESSQRRPLLHLVAGVLVVQTAAVAASLPWLIPQMHRFTELLFQ
jgi:hypothetical protein